ncbi:MAG: aryl-sulfate sulfotransferase [Parvularculaceae bacterium]|nr:MAG: aryl-sulfate sulfotransferase [Parvularculaceae bacterium]
MEKRSISIAGHRTSVALEREFWRALEHLASAQSMTLPKLIARVDTARIAQQDPPGLASALRVFVLREIAAPDAYTSRQQQPR